MKKLKNVLFRFGTVFSILQKRALKKPAFLLILFLIPLFSVVLAFATEQGNGVLTAAVWIPEDDGGAVAFAEELAEEKDMLDVVFCSSPEEARELVGNGTASYALILSSGFSEKIGNFARGEGKDPVMTMVVNEDNTAMHLMRERVFTMIFRQLSFEIFRDDILSLGVDPPPTEEEIAGYYDHLGSDPGIMEFVDVRGNEVDAGRMLTYPLRGLLSVLILEGGIAAAIFCAQDEEAGVFLRLSPPKRIAMRAFSVFVPSLDLAVASYLALIPSGLIEDPLRDVLLLLLFLLASDGLCLFLLALLRRPERLALAALFLAVLTLTLTPVFLQSTGVPVLSSLLPTYHYLRGGVLDFSVFVLFLYALIAFAASFLIFRFDGRNER